MVGIPYMGGKGGVSKPIVDYILKANPKCKYIYDLFGGGGAISFEFLSRPQIERVFYNELNTGVVELLKKIITDGITPGFYKWVSREEFNKLKNGDDWFSGLVKPCFCMSLSHNTYPHHSLILNHKILQF